MPSTFTLTMLAVALVLVLANAPLLPIYAVLGIGAVWQLLVSLASGVGEPPPYLEADDVERDS